MRRERPLVTAHGSCLCSSRWVSSGWGTGCPSETRSPQVSSITSQYRVLWSRSSCPHSSRVKVTATSLKVTDTCRAVTHAAIGVRRVRRHARALESGAPVGSRDPRPGRTKAHAGPPCGPPRQTPRTQGELTQERDTPPPTPFYTAGPHCLS